MSRMQITPNAIYQADCLTLLERLETGSARLVYLDPPFFEDLRKEEMDFDGYLDWLSQVIDQAYRVVNTKGSIFIHTEPRINSYIRLIAEELFSRIEFTEIILRKPKRPVVSRKPSDEHETLLVCTKSDEAVWNPITRPLRSDEIDTRFRYSDEHGRFTIINLTMPVDRPNRQYSWNEFFPPAGHSWRVSKEKFDQLEREGRIYIPTHSKRPYQKIYADEYAGTPIGTNWDDIPTLVVSRSKEKTGYETQQTLALLERVVQVSTNEGDLVVDPFFGSGTLVVAAYTLGRKWLGSDINELALETTKNRLQDIGISSPHDYAIGDEKALSSYKMVSTSKSSDFINILHRHNTRFVLNKKIHVEETRYHEFKEVVGNNPVKAIENTSDEYAVAFLNSEGGRIYWGVRNDDGVVVGVSLDYRLRDEVGKAINNKLSQIQPPIAPSSWRLEFHRVYKDKKLLQDVVVVELIVPRSPTPNMLFATGKGEVFIKTDSGKKKLNFMEMQAELAKRIIASESRS